MSRAAASRGGHAPLDLPPRHVWIEVDGEPRPVERVDEVRRLCVRCRTEFSGDAAAVDAMIADRPCGGAL